VLRSPILVVDDNSMILHLIEVLLRDAGYDVETATNGREALDAISRCRPALVLMDIQLPDANGLELTRMLKRREARNSPRIVAVTAYALREDRERAFAAGCDGFIAKPIDTRTFVERVASFLPEPA